MQTPFAEQLHAFALLRDQLSTLTAENRNSDITDAWNAMVEAQYHENHWFIPEYSHHALQAIVAMLNEDALSRFAQKYERQTRQNGQTIAVISAGNIPMAAFHDLFMVLMSGNSYQGKLSRHDKLLLPFITHLLTEIYPPFKTKIEYAEQLHHYDKVIATGSNNSARYFEYYFRNVPLLLRHNRHSAAVLLGRETEAELNALCRDILLYFGMGCRSVSKIFIPKSFDFQQFIKSIIKNSTLLAQHHPYLNNLDYHKTLMLMNQTPFLDAGTLILTENSTLASPVGVLHYSFYDRLADVEHSLREDAEQLQCIVSNCQNSGISTIPPGTAQQPALCDFADGQDSFLFAAN
ncbi:MAG: hypothetical protein LBK03_02845 [Bacteroidales bacterium]|jgi:hypothetical protein|nr:hypothetical protein [Bacteroidales bacterium]